MVNLLPQCIKCGAPVTDSLEDEIEQHGKIKAGSYINGVWTCNDCIIAASQAQKKEEEEQQNTVGVASKSDVSPNTPRADDMHDLLEHFFQEMIVCLCMRYSRE